MAEIYIRNLILWLIGLGGGMLIAGGVIALIVGLGILNRFAGITHTAKHTMLYETMVLAGSMYGVLLTVFGVRMPFGRMGLLVQGLAAGIYVGSWIMALAEVVRIFPIFARRVGLTKGISMVVIAVALGKTTGSLLQFYMGW